MKTIYKYPIRTDDCTAEIPVGAEVLSVGGQGLDLFVWAVVDSTQTKTALVRFNIYGTGHPLPDDPGEFVDTVHMQGGALVFHVFRPEKRK